jgi:hypothetical protein
MRHLHRTVVLILLLALAAAAPQAAAPVRNGPLPSPLGPPNHWWNQDISAAPVDPNSAAFITFIGSTRGMHPDFGGDAGGDDIYGMPYIVVDDTQPLRAVEFDYWDESDGVNYDTGEGYPFYPIPAEAITQPRWIEGGPPGNVEIDEDRHMLIYDASRNHLFELYHVWWDGSQWTAGSGAFFDLGTNGRRPEGWTSADAAGLAILPGLVKYDEVFGTGEIEHAFRVTLRASNGYVWPASHTAGSNPSALPMGARLRLKASVDISGFAPAVQKIFRAMKKYGLIMADNGSDLYVSGVYDTRWDNGVLNPAFAAIKGGNFEVIQLGYNPCGDLNADGATNAADLPILAQYLAGNISPGEAPFIAPEGGADLDGDGRATAVDLSALLHYLAGHIDLLPLP